LGKPIAGDVVIVPFPFSDLSETKRRPPLVLANLKGDDVILCMITSRAVADTYAIALDDTDFAAGGLKVASNVRPTRLFTAESSIVSSSAGRIADRKLNEVVESLCAIMREQQRGES